MGDPKATLLERLRREAQDARIRAMYAPTLKQREQDLKDAKRLEEQAKSTYFQDFV